MQLASKAIHVRWFDHFVGWYRKILRYGRQFNRLLLSVRNCKIR